MIGSTKLYEARMAAGKRVYKDYSKYVGYRVWLSKDQTSYTDKVTGQVRSHYWDFEVYPWSDAVPCPALVLAEYPNYILVRILPHLNPNSVYGELSHEYTQTIHKSYLDSGKIRMEKINYTYDEEVIE